jgi:hypothetical protein
MPTRPRAGPRSTTGPTCRGTSRAAKASTGSMPARPTAPRRSAPDHRRRGGQAVGLPLQGSARLVVEPALRPPGRGGERNADGVGAAVQADLVHRARLPGHRPGHQPAERLLRPEVVGELHAAFLAGLARRRDPARLSRGDVSLVGRGREQPAVRRLWRPDGACARMRRLDLGRAALSVLPGADRRLDGRRELAARALADGAARRGVAGGTRPPPLPARGLPETASTSPVSGARSRATPSRRWKARAPRSPRCRATSASTPSRPRA